MTPEQEARAVLDYDQEFTDALLFGEKVCSSCGKPRPKCQPHFPPAPRQEDGLKNVCQHCIADRSRELYAAAKGGIANRTRRRYEDRSLADAIIDKLRRRGMSYAAISAGTGLSKHFLQANAYQQGGNRSERVDAEALRKLVEFSESVSGTRAS